jgi:hypothetical protein
VRKHVQLCGARCRGPLLGRRCRWPVSPGKKRCWRHGGRNRSVTPKGFDTSAAMAGQKKWLARLHAMGLKRPQTNYPKWTKKQVETMAEEAKIVLHEAQQQLEEVLPADILTRDVATLSPAEALGRAALSGTHQLVRIIEQPLDLREGDPKVVPPPKADELKLQRLIGEMSNIAINALRRNATKEHDDTALDELLAEIRAEKAKDVTVK